MDVKTRLNANFTQRLLCRVDLFRTCDQMSSQVGKSVALRSRLSCAARDASLQLAAALLVVPLAAPLAAQQAARMAAQLKLKVSD